MIIHKLFDVEIFPNLFSVVIVDLADYLLKFADCVKLNSKGKPQPIPMTEKLSVKEIKERLDSVKKDIFTITWEDDSQLLEMVGAFNKMRYHKESKISDDGVIYEVPIRTDLYGFNSIGYDDNMIRFLLMKFDQCSSTKELIKELYRFSKKLISLQSDKEALYNDKEVEYVKSYKLPYTSVDLQTLFGLHSAQVNVDKDTGERNKFAKSLKQTSINLKWYNLLDFTLPPIDQEEYDIYWKHTDNYRGYDLTQLNKLITTDFDRYVLQKYVKDMTHYNCNDVYILGEMIRLKPDEVRLRYSITNAFNVDVLSSARANIADKLTVKFYSERSGLQRHQFIKLRTERHKLSFNKIIFPHIEFKTKQLQDFLEDLKTVSIYRTSKDEFSRTLEFYGTTYSIGAGGIHSVDRPGIYISDDKYLYKHHDYTSYYPSIMIEYELYPKHLNQRCFTEMLSFMKDTRVKCKHTKDEDGYVISGVPNKTGAEALKIVINSIYGKLGSELFFLYDRFVQMQVTINGQLMTLTLVEELELNGIHVISANTDGIIIKLPRDKEAVYKEITDRWNAKNRMGADAEDYNMLVVRDVNNYFDIQTDGTVEFKGSMDPHQYLKDLKKGYSYPIVAEAVYQYFVNNIPVMDTLTSATDILDFCMTQNIGRKFEVVYLTVENGNIKEHLSQRHVRFYSSTKGVVIMKKDPITGDCSRLANGKPVKILNQLDDLPIEERAINYKFYHDEAYKIIDPIKLGISPKDKGDANHKTKSGKALIKKYHKQYNSLFDDSDLEN